MAEILIGSLIIVAGILYVYDAAHLSDKWAKHIADAHPAMRLWPPLRFYSSEKLRLQCRLTGGVAIVIGLALIFCAVLLLLNVS
jgi:hypothetical protein